MEPGPIGQEPFNQPPQPPQAQAQPSPQQPAQVVYRGSRAGFWIAIIFGVLLLLSAGLNMFFMLTLVGGLEKTGEFKPSTDSEYSDPGAKDKIAVIKIEGIITDEDVESPFGVSIGQVSMLRGQLAAAESDPSVKAIILEVNSPGGYVTASDEMHHMLTEFKSRHTDIPIIAFMRDVAASGGYYVSVAADKIIAMPTCTTGSIGVIAMLPNVSKGLDKIGVTIYTFKSGAMKDAGSPFKPADKETGGMSKEDSEYFQKQIQNMYEKFLQAVYDGRRLKADWSGPKDPNLMALANGSVYMADEAKKNHLIDDIGYFEDAVREAKSAARITQAKVVRYRYVPPPRLLGLGGASTTNINTGVNVELDMNKMTNIDSPKFMYYWKP